MIRPMRDNIVVVPLEATDKVGLIVIPDNQKQGLRTHFKALVVAASPTILRCLMPYSPSEWEPGKNGKRLWARGANTALPDDFGPGYVVMISESWGEKFTHNGKTLLIGRVCYIDGIVDGERVKDVGKYLD